MNKLKLKNYDLKMTLLGGQAFNFDYFEDEKTYYGFTQQRIIKLKILNGENILWQTYPKNDDYNFFQNYFRLNINYEKILKKIKKDKYTKAAIKKYPNIRLLQQDFDQTLLSFLISSVNNIASIRSSVRLLSKKYGKRIIVDNKTFYLFPNTKKIANAKLKDLLDCKLGFRAKYLKTAANHILENDLTKKIYTLNENDAKKELISIFGTGEKIADCVLVFSLGFDSVTPLDVWAKRVLINFYNLNPKMNYKEMQKWLKDYFGEYTSWAGQYLFEYIRNENLK